MRSTTRSPGGFVLAKVLTLSLIATPALPQCNVTATAVTTTLSGNIVVTKMLSAPAQCTTTAMNAYICDPYNSPAIAVLYAAAMTATINPYCNWSCTCGTGAPPHVTIDVNDGLPVELLDFGIDEG